ncbi:hypothetical protein ACLOJK_019874 [Asimina triloba]
MSPLPIYMEGAAEFLVGVGITCGSYVVVVGRVRSVPAARHRSVVAAEGASASGMPPSLGPDALSCLLHLVPKVG